MKDSDEHRSSIGKMSAENQKLHTAIRNLDKDIADLKSEIKSRDDTISDKEKRITDLKRNAIELEKHRWKKLFFGGEGDPYFICYYFFISWQVP